MKVWGDSDSYGEFEFQNFGDGDRAAKSAGKIPGFNLNKSLDVPPPYIASRLEVDWHVDNGGQVPAQMVALTFVS